MCAAFTIHVEFHQFGCGMRHAHTGPYTQKANSKSGYWIAAVMCSLCAHRCMQRNNISKTIKFYQDKFIYSFVNELNARRWKRKIRIDLIDSIPCARTHTMHIRNERENNEKHSSIWNCFTKSRHCVRTNEFFVVVAVVYRSLSAHLTLTRIALHRVALNIRELKGKGPRGREPRADEEIPAFVLCSRDCSRFSLFYRFTLCDNGCRIGIDALQ